MGTPTTSTYLFGNEWRLARQRLDLLEAQFDRNSVTWLNALGIQEDWRCLDVGAGGGSIAAWLCKQVGPMGRVIATDIDTRLLKALDCPRLEVVERDIVREGFAEGEFDLVHTRAVLCHLAERQRALDHIIDALRPGGWAVIEEPDFATVAMLSASDSAVEAVFREVTNAKVNFAASRGFDQFYGRRVFDDLRARGLTDLMSEGRVAVTAGGSPDALFMQLSTQQMRERLLADGCVTDQAVDAYCALLADSAHTFRWPVMLATWGRKPRP